MEIESRGAELHFTVRGRGPACVVLSAIGAAPYERQLPAHLYQETTMVFLDLRGSGRSTGAPSDLTFDLVAADLEAVCASLGLGPVAVLGHSILGALAFECARRAPRRVSRAILVGTPPYGDAARLMKNAAAYFEAHADPERKRILQANLAALPAGAGPIGALFAETPKRFFDPRFDAAPLFEGAIARPEFFAHLLGTLTPSWEVTAGGPAVEVPVHVAFGRHDYVAPWTDWEAVLPALPTASLQLFEQSGHQPFIEEPEAFAGTLGRWMEASPQGR